MKFLQSVFFYLTSRYTPIQLAIILLIIVFGFFVSDSSIFARLSYDSKINDLEEQIEYYHNQTHQDSQKLKELESDKDHIEKFARENYLMKRENEDVFIIE